MKIFIMARSAKFGGIATYTQNLIQFLIDYDNTNNQYVIVVPMVAWSEKFNTIMHPRIKFIFKDPNSSWVKQFLWQQCVIPILLKKYKINILFSTANFGTFFSPCKQILLIRIPIYFSDVYIKTILRKKSFFQKIDFVFRKFLILLSAMQSDILLFPTDSMRSDFNHSFPWMNKKQVVNFYGTHIKKIMDGYANERKKLKIFTILYISTYYDYKNYAVLLNACVELKKRGLTSFQCVISIDFDSQVSKESITYNTDRELVLSEELRGTIVNLGTIPYAKVFELYKTADLFVWPTLTESFGHPIIEGMAAGCPIICSDIPINRELCGDAALYFDPFDHHELADKIQQFFDNTVLQQQFSDKGKKRCLQFEWNNHCQRLLQLFHKII